MKTYSHKKIKMKINQWKLTDKFYALNNTLFLLIYKNLKENSRFSTIITKISLLQNVNRTDQSNSNIIFTRLTISKISNCSS